MLQAGISLALPDGARDDLAFQQIVYLASVPPGQFLQYTVTGQFYEVILLASFLFDTDATVGNRRVEISFGDANGMVLGEIPPLNTQPASTSTRYTYAIAAPGFSGPDTGFQYGPLPSIVIYPGFNVAFALGGATGPNDQLSEGVVTVLRIPTGPPLSYDAGAKSIPTPILA